MNLITLTDIKLVTSLDDCVLTSLIPYAQAEAKARLGFLEEEVIEEQQVLWDSTSIIQVERAPIVGSVSLSYTFPGQEDPITIEEDTYKIVKSQGYLMLSSALPEGALVSINYTKGWTELNVPDLVKLLLITLTVHQYYSLYGSQAAITSDIVMEKIGDHTVKYGSTGQRSTRSLLDWCDFLTDLIMKEGYSPHVY